MFFFCSSSSSKISGFLYYSGFPYWPNLPYLQGPSVWWPPQQQNSLKLLFFQADSIHLEIPNVIPITVDMCISYLSYYISFCLSFRPRTISVKLSPSSSPCSFVNCSPEDIDSSNCGVRQVCFRCIRGNYTPGRSNYLCCKRRLGVWEKSVLWMILNLTNEKENGMWVFLPK